MLDVVSGGRIGGRLAMAVFDADTRPADDAPSSASGHIATDRPFCFRSLVCDQVVCDRVRGSMAGSSGDSLLIRHCECGGLMGLELTVAFGATMVGLDDRILL